MNRPDHGSPAPCDVLGRRVAALLDGSSLPAGVYLARLVVDADSGLRRVLARPVTLLR